MNDVAAAAQTIAASALGVQQMAWQHLPQAEVPGNLCGVYIPLLTEQYALHLGLLGQHSACDRLAKALLGMGSEESIADDTELFDAVGEIVNMMAGEVKARVSESTKLSLGVPLALAGKVFPSAGSSSTQGVLRLDGEEMWLVLTGQQTSKRAKSAA
jgi:hypothetical protein